MEPVGQKDPAWLDANEAGILEGIKLFDELVAKPLNGELKLLVVQYDPAFFHRSGQI